MWQVENRTGFRAAGTFQRDAAGHEHWCVAVRATFDIDEGGAVRPAAVQDDVTLAPRLGGTGGDVLLAEDDVIPFAPVTDIVIRGAARPAGAGDAPLPLSVEVGSMRKRAVLHPPRRVQLSRGRWRLVEAAPQAEASLGWKAAFGGVLPGAPPDQPPDNPLGTGILLRAPDRLPDRTEVALPRIEGAGMDCLRDPRAARPVGFGPVPRWWRERVALAGTFDETWRRGRAPAMPDDHDPRFACSGPRDQWPDGHLAGGEPVSLVGFTGGRPWQFRLPQAVFRIDARVGRGVQPMPAHLARIDLSPSESRLSMLWLASLRCDGRDHLIETTRVTLRQIAGVTR